MSRVAIIADIHLGVKGSNTTFLDFQMNYFEYFLEQCKVHQVKRIFQLGDWLDVRKTTNNILLHCIHDRLIPLIRKYNIPIVTIAGNHDQPLAHDNSLSTTQLLKKLCPELIHVVTNYEEIDNISCIGWLNKNNTNDILDKIKHTNCKIAMGHFEIVGFNMSATNIATHGMERDFLSKYETVFSGHYHNRNSGFNIHYIGAPTHLTWADYIDGTNRGFEIFDLVTHERTFISNNEEQTMFHTIQYDPDHKYKAEDFTQYEGKIVKVVVNDKGTDKKFKEFDKLLKEVSFLEYSIIDNTIIEKTETDVSVEEVTVNTLEAFNKYIDAQEGVDHASVKMLAHEIYREVC